MFTRSLLPIDTEREYIRSRQGAIMPRPPLGYIPHPRATSRQLEASVREAQPSPEVFIPLYPRPHPRAALIIAALPPSTDAFPSNHPLRKSPALRILVWQLSTYTRDVHVDYQQWEFFDADQTLALPWTFLTQEHARRFLAARRIAKLEDTPPAERGSLGQVYWSPGAIAAITPACLTHFGATIHASHE